MKSSGATKKPTHQTVTLASLAMHAPGEGTPGLPTLDIQRGSFAKIVEHYAATLRGHLRARGFEFIADDLVTPLKRESNPDRLRTPDSKTEVAEDHAGKALLHFWHAKKALADGQADRAASYAMMGGVMAGQALILFYREQDSKFGRNRHAENQRADRDKIVALAKGIWGEFKSPPSAKQLYSRLPNKLTPEELPDFKTFQANLTRADWKKWPHSGRNAKKVPR